MCACYDFLWLLNIPRSNTYFQMYADKNGSITDNLYIRYSWIQIYMKEFQKSISVFYIIYDHIFNTILGTTPGNNVQQTWKVLLIRVESVSVCMAIQIFPAHILYPPHRGYISFVNTFVTPRNKDLGPYVPWRHLISAKFQDIWYNFYIFNFSIFLYFYIFIFLYFYIFTFLYSYIYIF